MIEVRMGPKHAVDRAHALAFELVAQIGRRVQKKRALVAHEHAAVAASGARIASGLLAGGAFAEEGGHAAARARAEEREGGAGRGGRRRGCRGGLRCRRRCAHDSSFPRAEARKGRVRRVETSRPVAAAK